jgi:hypothetical protein
VPRLPYLQQRLLDDDSDAGDDFLIKEDLRLVVVQLQCSRIPF